MKMKLSIFGIKSYCTSITTTNVYAMLAKVNSCSVIVPQSSTKVEYKNYSSMKFKEVLLYIYRTEPIYSSFYHNHHTDNLYKSAS